MPEMPEVEMTARSIACAHGRKVTRAEAHPVSDRKLEGLSEAEGEIISAIGRRGKVITISLEPSGNVICVQLGMTGRLSWDENDSRHLRAALHLEDAEGTARLSYHDPRRFGSMTLHARAQDHHLIPRLGPEVAEAQVEQLAEKLARRRTPIKTALLDQTLIAGLGNIYADEALHEAGIAPGIPAADLEQHQVARLLEAARATLEKALAAGGTTLRDYRMASGREGGMQDLLKVYGRAGLPCTRCSSILRKQDIGGRSSTSCPVCQTGGKAEIARNETRRKDGE